MRSIHMMLLLALLPRAGFGFVSTCCSAIAIRLFASPRTEPLFGRQTKQVRSYPGGFRIDDLGTFAPGCPVSHSVAS